MTATAANARLLGYTEGPSDAWRTALALVQTPSNPGPLPKDSSFAACRLGLDGAMSCSLAYERLMRLCKSGSLMSIVWLVRPSRRAKHVQSLPNDVS